MLPKTDHLLELVIAVVVNTIILTCPLSLKCAVFVRNEATLPRYVRRSRPPLWSQNGASVTVDSSKPTHQVTQDPCESVPSEYTLLTLPSQQTKPLQMNIEVKGYHFSMEIN